MIQLLAAVAAPLAEGVVGNLVKSAAGTQGAQGAMAGGLASMLNPAQLGASIVQSLFGALAGRMGRM